MDAVRISVSKDVKTIAVNDAGDTITVNISDYALMADLADLARELEVAAKDVAEKAAEIDSKSPNAVQQARSVAGYNKEICTTIKARVDGILGEGTCLKVFGDIVPSIPAQLDFLGQLTEVINGFMKEAQEAANMRLAKYLDKYSKREGEL